MARWTRPTTVRPDHCRWHQLGTAWEFGPPGCELVYVLDDDLTDARERDASVRLVEAVVAVHPDGTQRQFRGMTDHFTHEAVPHSVTVGVIPRRWVTEVRSSTFCAHHADHPAPHQAVHEETWLVHDTADYLTDRLPVGRADLEAHARFDADRALHVVQLDIPGPSKRLLERDLARHLGHERVRLP